MILPILDGLDEIIAPARPLAINKINEALRPGESLVVTCRTEKTLAVDIPGCHHKGDDPDYSRWARLDTPRAWERLGNGEQLAATGGQGPGLIARTRCQDCVSHGPCDPMLRHQRPSQRGMSERWLEAIVRYKRLAGWDERPDSAALRV